MNEKEKSPPTQRQRILYPVLSALSGGILLLLLLLGLRSPLAYAAPAAATRYVNGNGGSDTTDCSNSAAPCATIQYAISQSAAGDEIRVAQGTYTETLGIGITLTLKGGYEVAGWTRDIAANPTLIDANGADASVVNITPGINVFIEGFTIQGANHASDNGGGFLVNDATVIISATVMQNNATSGGGGGIWYEGNNVNISVVNSSLLNNSAGNSGGGVTGCCTGGNGIVSLNNVAMRDNSAPSGGGLSLADGRAVITNSQIISNTAVSGEGGGFNVSTGTVLTIANSSVLSNTAVNGGGGGLSAFSANLSLSNVTVQGNQAGNGGGLNLGQTTADITGSQIANNSATMNGGGVNIDNNSTVTLTGSSILGNQVVSGGYAAGGGVDTRNSSLTLHDSLIADNVVQSTGGGETLGGAINNSFGSVEITNSIIRNNNSQGTPAMQIYQAALTMTNVLVNDNQGPGFAGSPTQGTFTNVTITNNSGFGLGIGPLEAGDPPVNVTIANAILWGNTGTDYYCDTAVGQVSCTLSYSDVEAGNTGGTGNISADPLFVAAANGDYHLQVGSPAIDAGTAVGAPADDLTGAPRDAAPDMGAFEWSGYRLYLPTILKP